MRIPLSSYSKSTKPRQCYLQILSPVCPHLTISTATTLAQATVISYLISGDSISLSNSMCFIHYKPFTTHYLDWSLKTFYDFLSLQEYNPSSLRRPSISMCSIPSLTTKDHPLYTPLLLSQRNSNTSLHHSTNQEPPIAAASGMTSGLPSSPLPPLTWLTPTHTQAFHLSIFSTERSSVSQ